MPEAPAVLLDLDALTTTLRAALAPLLGEELRLALGWPMASADDSALHTRRGPSALVALGLAPDAGDVAPWLWLEPALAVNLVDRALGGRGQLGTASAAAMLSEAECGVLAYLAAKVARALDGVWIRDVRATQEPPPRASLLWPVSLRWDGGAGTAMLGWPALEPERAARCQVGWLDRLSVEHEAALEVGDVLVSDSLALSATTHGLAGPGCLRVAGIADTLPVLLDGAHVHGRNSERPAPQADALLVALHDTALTLDELARLSGGGTCALPVEPPSVHLLRGARELAQAELVRVEGAIGVRITSLG